MLLGLLIFGKGKIDIGLVGDAIDARSVDFYVDDWALIECVETTDDEDVAFLPNEVYDAEGGGVGAIGGTRGEDTDWIFTEGGGGAVDGAICTVSKIDDIEMGGVLDVDEAVFIFGEDFNARFEGGKTTLPGCLVFAFEGAVDDADGSDLERFGHI